MELTKFNILAAVIILSEDFLAVIQASGLKGYNLKLAAYHVPPFDNLVRQQDGNYTMEGCNINNWKWLSAKLKFSIVLVPIVDEALIAKIGHYVIAMNKLVDKEADAVAGALVPNPERMEKGIFSTFLTWNEQYTLIVPRPAQKSRLLAFIRPFQPLVWLFLAATVVAVIATMSVFSQIYNNSKIFSNIGSEKRDTSQTQFDKRTLDELIKVVSFYGIYAVNILTNHGMYTPYFQHSFRLLAGCWLLAALVLVNSYSSIVVSSLTVPMTKPAVNSLEDLVSSDEVFLVLRKDMALGHIVLNAKTGVLKHLGDQARANPDRLFVEDSKLFQKLQEGRYAYPWITSFTRVFLGNQFKKEGRCRFKLSDPLQMMSSTPFFLLQNKHFQYTRQLSIGLIQYWETGLTRHCMDSLVSKPASRCYAKDEKLKSSIRQVGIKLEDLTSAFLILGVGNGLGVLVFFIELLNGICKKKYWGNFTSTGTIA